jgi:hypothetical protein
MAVNQLLKLVGAIESTAGSAATATRVLYVNEATPSQEVTSIANTTLRGNYFETYEINPGIERNGLNVAGPVLYNQIPFWLETAVKGGVSASGTAAPYTWAYTPNSGTANAPKTFTAEWGWADGGTVVPTYLLAGCATDELSITYVKDEAVTFSATTIAAGTVALGTAYSASPSDTTQVSVLGVDAAVYIDATTIGSTADTSVQEATFTLTRGLVRRDALDGTSAAVDTVAPVARQARLEIVRYFTNRNELDKFLLKSERKIRIAVTGPTLGAGNYEFTLDFYGVADTHEIAEVDGVIVANITYRGIVDSSASTDFSITVKNNLATIS